MIEIKQLNKSDLLSYINSDTFQTSPVIAISKHRAISQCSNPRSNDKDILLLLAYEDNKMVGYLGVLPDDLNIEGKENIHIGWMSCLWIDPNHRGKKIAQKLIYTCFDAWNNHILLTEYTAAAGSLYHKMGIFSPFHCSSGQRYYIRADLQTILPPKKPIYATISPLLKLFDGIFNVVLEGINYFYNKKLMGYSIKQVSEIENEVKELICKTSTYERFRRIPDDLNWILKYPWILQNDHNTKESQKYHFTSVAKVFECKGVEIRNSKNDLAAFIIYTNRNGHLRLPYIYYKDNPEAIRVVCRFLISELKIKTCTIYNEECIKYLNKYPLLKVPHKRVERNYLISTYLSNLGINNHQTIQDGDGDCAFT